ncbi:MULTISPECIES: CapA family protein [Agrobacterium]|uniref:CapA family protein n=1 Tax=Agrobacterium rubi TaxID=28099 RepID=A0AAE7UQT1_9HYPH|nr:MULTISPECIES: CapA family protein [Agrobacterium]MBN7807773.1 CapA family protein [Agrobacterium rosae]NTE89732.1 CapA family protein [Agrobacterium rubi]NTF05418.1 CapA family protein [Agrobacterium rubi]NTF39862.1 CapA family protein [Agrobacterium rubi]OCJ44978.1 capsule biosynthesis protein CapA [Agrobacterium rubi]
MTNAFTVAVTGQSLIKHDIRTLETPGFEAVRKTLRKSDFAFTNFESTIFGSHGGWPMKGSFFGSSQPVVLDTLQSLGFHGLSLSNNHAYDLGSAGILSTLEEVERRGFLHAGIGRNRTAAARSGLGSVAGRKIALVAMDGGPGPDFMYAADAAPGRPERPGINRLKLTQIIDVDSQAFEQLAAIRDKVGYTSMDLGNDSQPDDKPIVDDLSEIALARGLFRRSETFGRNVKIDPDDLGRNLAAITAAANSDCLVVAYLHHHHWASDWYQVPGWVGSVARQCIDAGAHMFVSHGAPVLQPLEIYQGKPIFYSLGNFVFHIRPGKSKWTAREVWESVIGLCSFNDMGLLTGIALHPVLIGGTEGLKNEALDERIAPEIATGEDGQRILQRFQRQCAQFGTAIRISEDVGYYDAT